MKLRRRALLLAGVLAVIFGAEFLLFDGFGSRRVTGIYPRWNDQIQYLSEAYLGHEYARAHGLGPALWHTLTNQSAQGTLHDVAAALVFHVAGPSRSAALAINMAAMLAWQATLAFAVWRRRGSVAWAVLASMLPLALRGPWENVPGSAYDFRLDHLALCALGVTSAMALLTDSFRSRRWSIAFGFAAGVTLATRFITGTYLLVVFLALFAWMASTRERGRRLIKAALAAITAATIAGPIFWLNRESLWNYYYVGHYIGPESAIRNQNFGLLASLRYILHWVTERHVGLYFGLLAGGLLLALAALHWLQRRRAGGGTPTVSAETTAGEVAWLGLVFLLAPAFVLTLHAQKSEVVLSALLPGIVVLTIAALLGANKGGHGRDRRLELGVAAVATVATLATLVFFAHRQLRPIEATATLDNARQVNGLMDYVFTASAAAGIASPRVAVDHITDAFDAQVLRVVGYERHRIWKNLEMTLPTGIAAPDREVVWQRLSESDFVFLLGADAPVGPYPFDRTLASLRPQLRRWCEENLQAVKRFDFSGTVVTLYQRRDIPTR